MNRTLARIGIAALAAVLAAGAFAVPASAAAEQGTIQGTFGSDSGAPIVGASVAVYTAVDFDYIAETTTDEAGAYTVPDVPAGSVKVLFETNGLQQWAHGARDFETATAFAVAAGRTLTVDERLPSTGTITGQLSDSSGDPVPWVSVQATSQGDDSSTVYGVTGEDGSYSVDVLPGDYTVTFQHGNTQQYAYHATSIEEATTFTVAAGQSVRVDDRLLPTGTLSGHLATADGGPLADTGVMLRRDFSFIGYATTDENGDYSFADVLPGDYQVSFEVNGADQWIPGTLDEAKAKTFTVTAGANTVIDDDAPLPTGAAHGRLVDAGGAGLAGYDVDFGLDDEGSFLHYHATTDADGNWSVDGVVAGRYLVGFTPPDYSRTQYAYGKGTSADADRIVVAAGGDTTVDDAWQPGASLTVTLSDARTGAPLSDFCVYVFTAAGNRACTDGAQLTVGDLPGGTFSFDTQVSEDSFYLDRINVRATLVAGQTTTVNVPLQLGGRVATTVTDHATGEPVESCIDLRTLDGGGLGDNLGSACGDAQGAVTTRPLAAGTYEMFAYGPDTYGHQWVGRSGGTGDQQAAAKIVVRPGKIVNATPVRLDQAGTVTGTVTGADGQPVADGYVSYSAWNYGAGPTHGTDTDSSGHYTLTGLGPYSWPLLFDDGPVREWSGGVGNRFAAKSIRVRASATTTYNTRMKAGAAIKGTVTVAPGSGAGSWRLTAFNAVTGDVIGVADSYGTVGGAYRMVLPGDQGVKISWYLSAPTGGHDGWYDHAADQASAKTVRVPRTGTKKLDLTIN
jgi:hypothetical protein